jgi:hypothetical protein
MATTDVDDEWEMFKRNMKMGGGDDHRGSDAMTSDGSCVSNFIDYPDYPCYGEVHNNSTTSASALHGEPSTLNKPKCSDIYISTTTKIAHLNMEIDIKKVFWEIPVIRYVDPVEGVIKKQIKFSTTDRSEYDEIIERIKNERYCDNQEIEHIDNPDGRIKFKDQRKISVGISKKDILCYRSKKKRAFFNCFVIIIRILTCDGDRPDESSGLASQSTTASSTTLSESTSTSTDHLPEFKEMHVKIFNTGKLEIPGIQNLETLHYVLKVVTRILRPAVSPELNYIQEECDTVLINSNFNCGFYIDRDKLHEILKYKYRINSNYDSCSYPGIQSKFYYVPGREVQNGQQPHYTKLDKHDSKPSKQLKEQPHCEISFMIFRTGSVLIVGKCSEDILFVIYNFLKTLLEDEYEHIVNLDGECDTCLCKDICECPRKILQPSAGKKQNLKIQRRIITCSEVQTPSSL